MLRSKAGVLETCIPTLYGAQTYLKARSENEPPEGTVAEAWEAFYRMYDDLIRRFVVAQGIPRCDVDDCVQEVWTEVANRLVQFDRPTDRPGLRAWLYALVRSKATNVYRKKARQPVSNLDEAMNGGNEAGDSQADPAALYERQWEQVLLDSVLAQLREELSPTNVRIMEMRMIAHRSVSEVAAELNIPPERVHARQHRIMKKLKARISLYTGDDHGWEG